jgi:hypothetical protein
MRSIGLILAAFAVVSTLVLGGELIMQRLIPASFDDQGVSHDARVLAIALAYTILLYCLGGYVVAALAPRSKGKHVLGFGIVMLAAAGATIWLDYYTAPRWSHIASVLSPIPAAVLGGRIRGHE